MFEFTDFIERIGLSPDKIKLLRHDERGVAAWRRGGTSAFGCFASFQKASPDPYQDVNTVCHFLPGPTLQDGSLTALYIGATNIVDRWSWDGGRKPRIIDDEIISYETGKRGINAFDIEWLASGSEYSERILIDWGPGGRAWFQWADRRSKQILELRLQPQEPPFPGFSRFRSRISEIPTFPQSWLGALEGVRGVYLLVSEQGDQYIGSATGADGFIGRWRSYLANGHGGNVLLRNRGYRDYDVSILEVASPDMSLIDILGREAHWKDKLGVRAHGLNAN